MARNQTCTVACEILCSIPFSPVPFAVFAAAVIGFVVGKLQSSRPISSPHDGDGNRSGFSCDSSRIPPVDESCRAEPGPQLRSAVGEGGPAGDGARPARIAVHAAGRGRQLQDSENSSDSGFADSTTPLLVDSSAEDVLSLAPKSNSSRSSPSSRSSLMDLQERRQGLSPKTPKPTLCGPQSPRRQNSLPPHFSAGSSHTQPHDPHLATETPGRHRTPAPVSIPRSPNASGSGTTPINVTAEPVFEAYENMDYSPRAETNEDSDDDEMLPAAAWMCGADAANKKLQCGLSWLNLVEPSLEDVYGQIWMDSVHSDDYKKCKDVINEAMVERGPFQVQYRLQMKTGFRWVLDLGKPRFSCNNQRFLGYVGWRIDIEHSKKIENDYEKYWSLPHELLIKAGADGRFFEDVSPSFPRLLGYAKEDFLQIEWMHLLHPDDREHTLNIFKTVSQGNPVVNVINRYRCNPNAKIAGPCFVDSTGTYKWISWTANFLFGAGRDISLEKQSQLELQRSQEELQRITDAIPGGVFQYRVDEDGVQTFPFISKGAMHMSGSLTDGDGNFKSGKGSPTTDDMEKEVDHYGFQNDGEHNSRLRVHPQDWPKLKEAMRQSSLSGSSLDFDYRLLRGDEVRWVRVHAAPLAREEGGQDWCGITWDMTEQHLAEAALRAERDHAEKLSHAKGAFLANMSHEIRTPMNAVIGMGALLLETELNDEQRDYVSTIRSSGEALLGVINDILDFSKIEAGKMELEVAPFDICDCIEESLDLITTQAAAKGLELNYELSETVPTKLRGDAGRLRQILVNLLSNAVKFTPHGSVSIAVDGHCRSVGADERSETSLSTETKPSAPKSTMWEIHVVVRDTGIGIPEDRRHALFQPFSQVDASTTRRYGGTGLGLAICARLTALLGGQIWVESNQSHGSAFHCTFVAEAAGTPGEGSVRTSLQMRHVLVIAGTKSSTQTAVSRFLKSWHALPVLAVTVEEAQRWVHTLLEARKTGSMHINIQGSDEQEPLSVVIMDCAMLEAQDLQLLDCLTMLREAAPRIPVILLTPFGRRGQDYAKEYPNLDFDAFVQKPVKASVLLTALMTVFSGGLDSNMDVGTNNLEQIGTPQPVLPDKRRVLFAPTNSRTMDGEMGKVYPLRILIAEDNVINQKVLVRLLLRHGYNADVVANGLEALDAASRGRYDVILMDCFMPEMDGLEATRKIRSKVQPCPVIVAVTAAALDDEKQACLEAGMHTYIAKPIQAEQLVSVLTKCWQVKDGKLDPDCLQPLAFGSKQAQRM